MRFKVEHRVGVPASSKAIWDVLSDLPRWREWNTVYPEIHGLLRIQQKLAIGEAFPGQPDRVIRPMVVDTNALIHEGVRAKKKMLFEGAQGAMLDIDQGTYPFVTSSNTTSGGVTTGAGVPPSSVQEVIAITKAYTTRVGTGPMTTELSDEVGEHLQRVGVEFGATTGRRRRCGWLDLVQMHHSNNVNGITGLAITKLDVLSGLKEIKVCVAYEIDGKEVTLFPSNIEALAKAKPIYKTFKGWDKNLQDVRSAADMPQELKDYVAFIEKELGVKSVILSVGPDRNQTFELRNPFGA